MRENTMMLKDYIRQLCYMWAKTQNFSGVCQLNIEGETVFQQAYGYANRAFEIPNQIDTRFDTASITKLFTAVAILQLVQKGQLYLEDKITELLDLKETKIAREVTIHHLLNHTSGIADDAEEEAGEDYSALFLESPNYAIRECKDFLKNFAYKEPNFTPGTGVRYCNCSFVLLGMAIEKASGQNFREYFNENIFNKAGMKHSGFLSMEGINPNTAEGYKSIIDENGGLVGYKKNIYSYPPQGTPDGGAYTTAEDLNLFLSAIQNHVLLNEAYSKLFLEPHCDFFEDKAWYEIPGLTKQNGYAWEFYLLPNRAVPFCIYKDGQNDGVACKFSYYLEKQISLVLLSNQDCDVWRMTKEIQLELYRLFYM